MPISFRQVNYSRLLRTVLSTNHVLADLTTTPLMLSVLTLTYMGDSVPDLPHRGSAQEQQHAVFATYIERMVERKGNSLRYPLERTKTWLGWLARQMHIHDQTVFYLEHLQPDWLTPTQRRSYAWLAVPLPTIMIGVLVSLFVMLLLGPIDQIWLFQSGVIGGVLALSSWYLSFQTEDVSPVGEG